MADDETQYEYLKHPNQILLTETYKFLYAKLCEQDELYTEMLKLRHLGSLQHSTVITHQESDI